MLLYLTSKLSESIEKIDFLGKKKLAFIDLAAKVYERRDFVDADREAFVSYGLEVQDVDISWMSEDQVHSVLSDFDIIFFSWWSSQYLLKELRKCNFSAVLRQLLSGGILYVGSSAWSIIVWPDIEYVKYMDSKWPALDDWRWLGVVNCMIMPHRWRDKYAKIFETTFKEFDKKNMLLLTDQQVVKVENWTLQVI